MIKSFNIEAQHNCRKYRWRSKRPFDDNTVLKNYGELEKPILDLENGNRRIDALDVLIVLNDFPTWNQIREILGYGYWYSDNLTIIKKYLKNWN